jgi:hypothetical protein
LLLAPAPNTDERACLLGRRQSDEPAQRDLDERRFADVVLDDRGDSQRAGEVDRDGQRRVSRTRSPARLLVARPAPAASAGC